MGLFGRMWCQWVTQLGRDEDIGGRPKSKSAFFCLKTETLKMVKQKRKYFFRNIPPLPRISRNIQFGNIFTLQDLTPGTHVPKKPPWNG